MGAQISPNDIDVVNLLAILAQHGGALPPATEGLPGIYCGKVAPTFAAAAGSLYLEQNGATSGLYINQSAVSPGTTWTAVTVP